ncbi:hypothetical protein JW890_05335 [candidate division WOR-3 bacterium]|nr:hypothetical protein [candidate division WOR-3 bacterium]
MMINSLRIKANFPLSESFGLNSAYKLSLSAADPFFENRFRFQNTSFRTADFNPCLYFSEDNRAFFLNHDLDRLYLSLKTKKLDIFAGRQALSWGMSRFISPSDLINKTSFFEPDREEGRGVDALIVRMPIRKTGEITAGLVSGRGFNGDSSCYFTKLRTSFKAVDTEILLALAKKTPVAALSFSLPFKGALLWTESAFFLPNRSENNSHFCVNYSAGFDYFTSNGLYLFLEYFFNGFGERSKEDYIKNALKPGYIKGFAYLGAKDYISWGFSKQIFPLVSLVHRGSVNLNDNSVFYFVNIEINLRENLYLGSLLIAGKTFEDEKDEYGDIPGNIAFYSSIYF